MPNIEVRFDSIAAHTDPLEFTVSTYRLAMVDLPGASILFSGAGFLYDANDLPIAGVITSISLVVSTPGGDAVMATLTNINVSMDDLGDFIRDFFAVRAQVGWTGVLADLPEADVNDISPTEIRLLNADGSYTVLIGNGFDVSVPGALAGNVTQIQHVASNGATVLEAVNVGTTLELAISGLFEEAAGNSLYQLFNEGSNTFTGGTNPVVVGGDTYSTAIIAGPGNDTINGGQVSWLDYEYSPSGVNANLNTGQVTGGLGTDAFTGINSLAGSYFNDTLIGNGQANWLDGRSGDDTLTGNDGDDTLEGRDGNDIMSGGNGNDTVTYNSFDIFNGVTVSLALGGAQDTIGAGVDTITGVENVVGTEWSDTLTGNAEANTLEGREGNDTLNGGGGSDTLNGGFDADAMAGGQGDDLYFVDHAGDTVTEGASAGTDQVISSVTFTLTANIENLALGGGSAITGYGNALGNVITGNGAANTLYGFDGNDLLNGSGGADSMFGGNGDDQYFVDNANDITSEVSALGGTDIVFSTVNRNLTAHIENLTLMGGGAITGAGNALSNTITGNGAANTLYGFDGNDTLNGGAGADTLFGAAGNDIYVVDNVNDITVEGLSGAAGGIDTVQSSIDRNLNANFENLTLTGTAQFGYGNVLDNTLTGNASSNSLYGFDGSDTLDGGAGADNMYGGNGHDIYIVDNAGDVTSEASPSGGTDTVISSVTRNLTANIENLELSGSANITGAGNALNNEISGNSGANTLYGLDGNDMLEGGLGADTLQGGTGADDYVFMSTLGGGNVDTIVGFSVVDDQIMLGNNVFTGIAVGTLASNAFVIGAEAVDADDRIIYNSATGALSFDVDGVGGAAAIQFATLAAGLALTNNDFIVFDPTS